MITANAKPKPKRSSARQQHRRRQGSFYPHIERKPGVVGGEPIVRGTRTTVRAIAGYYQMGKTVDEILSTLRHLTQAQVHAALAYYFDNKAEVDKLTNENEDYRRWKAIALSHPRQGK
jgi:uncharacterized protein (DUF433 family)